MAKIKNVSPIGDLFIPVLELSVKAGATIEVDAENAALLLEQTDNWAAADRAAVSVTTTPTTPAPVAPAASE